MWTVSSRFKWIVPLLPANEGNVFSPICLSVSLFTVRGLHVTNTDFFKLVHSLGTSPPDGALTLPVWVPSPPPRPRHPSPRPPGHVCSNLFTWGSGRLAFEWKVFLLTFVVSISFSPKLFRVILHYNISGSDHTWRAIIHGSCYVIITVYLRKIPVYLGPWKMPVT